VTGADISRPKRRGYGTRSKYEKTVGRLPSVFGGTCSAVGIIIIIIIIIIINDNVYGAVIVTMVTARVHPVHLMNAD